MVMSPNTKVATIPENVCSASLLPLKKCLLLTSSAWKIILAKDNVEMNTPLTATKTSTADKPYVFCASKSTTKVAVYNDGKSSDVAVYVPGTKLGAVTLNGDINLFQKQLEHPTSIWTLVQDCGRC